MKKTLLAAALLAGFAGAASAQSSVTLYGVLDGGLRYSSVSLANGTGVTNFGGAYGVQSGNRWGMKGVESLGNGNNAMFQIESGFDMGNGAGQQGGRLFGRASWVGLQNAAWGDVRLGRMTNLTSDWMVGGLDPFAAGFGQLNMGNAFTSGNTVRLDNVLMYRTPVMSGFQAGLGYSFATGLTSNGGTTGYGFATSNNSRQITAGLKYANGPFYAAATYEKAYAAESTAMNGQSINNWNIGGSYDLKVVKIGVAYGQTRDGFWAGSGAGGTGATLATTPSGSSNALVFAPSVGYNSYIVGATIPVNAVSRVLLSWTMIAPNTNMKDAYNAQNQSSFNLGYTYDFTKRTNLYTYVGQTQNYATVDTAKSTIVGVGIRHQF
ncbi:porin [Alcaligenaceae bacterium LF4-65]|uniref:Porin n=1 Tax=Zwartia hollandica TaxID=324606 RepID=A0A953T888_9BURK|nr:porin [Zwartia hollandica]MBZ1351484.1 porin [Zwartia hollandica]